MQELITVQKTILNGAEVNSVNARELHKILEVRKAFTTWIVTALENAGAINGEDYLLLKSSLEGSGYQLDYVITTEMAKHIAMMSKVPKGKEVRDYFIECERRSIQIQLPTNPMEILQLVFDAQKATNIELIEIKDDLEGLKNDIVLTPSQKRILQKSVNSKVFSFEVPKESHSKLYSKIWSKVKDRFTVSSYMEIPRLQFNEAKSMVDNITLIDLV